MESQEINEIDGEANNKMLKKKKSDSLTNGKKKTKKNKKSDSAEKENISVVFKTLFYYYFNYIYCNCCFTYVQRNFCMCFSLLGIANGYKPQHRE